MLSLVQVVLIEGLLWSSAADTSQLRAEQCDETNLLQVRNTIALGSDRAESHSRRQLQEQGPHREVAQQTTERTAKHGAERQESLSLAEEDQLPTVIGRMPGLAQPVLPGVTEGIMSPQFQQPVIVPGLSPQVLPGVTEGIMAPQFHQPILMPPLSPQVLPGVTEGIMAPQFQQPMILPPLSPQVLPGVTEGIMAPQFQQPMIMPGNVGIQNMLPGSVGPVPYMSGLAPRGVVDQVTQVDQVTPMIGPGGFPVPGLVPRSVVDRVTQVDQVPQMLTPGEVIEVQEASKLAAQNANAIMATAAANRDSARAAAETAAAIAEKAASDKEAAALKSGNVELATQDASTQIVVQQPAVSPCSLESDQPCIEVANTNVAAGAATDSAKPVSMEAAGEAKEIKLAAQKSAVKRLNPIGLP